MAGSNVRIASTRAARTAGESARTTSGRRKNTKSCAVRGIISNHTELLFDFWVLGNLCEFVVADEILLVKMEQSTGLAQHDLRRLFQVHFVEFQWTSAIIALARVFSFLFHASSTKSNLRLVSKMSFQLHIKNGISRSGRHD